RAATPPSALAPLHHRNSDNDNSSPPSWRAFSCAVELSQRAPKYRGKAAQGLQLVWHVAWGEASISMSASDLPRSATCPNCGSAARVQSTSKSHVTLKCPNCGKVQQPIESRPSTHHH